MATIFNDRTPMGEAEGDRQFARYKADFASRTFEAADADAKRQSSLESGNWFVIAGAWSHTQKIKARMALLKSNNISAHVIDTDDYANLTPGLKAVVLGPTSKDQAQALLNAVQSIVPDAFIKQSD